MGDDRLFEAAHVKLADWMAPLGDMFTASTFSRGLHPSLCRHCEKPPVRLGEPNLPK